MRDRDPLLSARRFISLARSDLPVAIGPATSTWHGVVPGVTGLLGLHPVRRKRRKRGEMRKWERGKRELGTGKRERERGPFTLGTEIDG
jgi:hypothetical protein